MLASEVAGLKSSLGISEYALDTETLGHRPMPTICTNFHNHSGFLPVNACLNTLYFFVRGQGQLLLKVYKMGVHWYFWVCCKWPLIEINR